MSEKSMPEDVQRDLWLANAKIDHVMDWRHDPIKQLPIYCHGAGQVQQRRKRKIVLLML
jgi:hypothetical protein